MLTAIMNSGERICLGDSWEKRNLLLLREQGLFYCPYCHEKVILKLGEKRIFHFSHLKASNCQFEHKGESDYHLNGKIQLYQWLKKQSLNPVLEFYDSALKQRADIMFTHSSEKYTLELQCSAINESTLSKRTKGYQLNGYTPIWILGANQLTRKTSSITTFSDFHYSFLRETLNKTWMIPFYCSNAQKFILHYSIQPITIRNALSDQRIISLDKMDLHQLLNSPKTMIVKAETWIKELNRWKTKLIRYLGAYQNPFLISLYQNHLNLLTLPPYLGFPVEKSPCILTPPFIWQTYILIDVLLKKKAGCFISFQEIYQAFLKRQHLKQIQIRPLPLIGQVQPSIAVSQFCYYLVHVGVLTMIDENTFILAKTLEIPMSIEESQIMEQTYIKNFPQVIRQK
ncbi:competence protein CoiA [Pseudoneobacillus sp. C159]